MSESRDRNICPRDTGPLEARMFVTLLRLGRKVPVRGLDREIVKGLMVTSRKLKPEELLHVLSLDARFVECTRTIINENLNSATEQVLSNNSKGGE